MALDAPLRIIINENQWIRLFLLKLRDLVSLAQPKANVGYVYFKSADGYYESWDIASALHPQTLIAYQKNSQPLTIDNGAPLRLACYVKLT